MGLMGLLYQNICGKIKYTLEPNFIHIATAWQIPVSYDCRLQGDSIVVYKSGVSFWRGRWAWIDGNRPDRGKN